MSQDSDLMLWFPVWGDMIRIWSAYCTKALMQPENLPALGCSRMYVDCWTTKCDEGRVLAIATQEFGDLPNVKISVHTSDNPARDSSRHGPRLAFERKCKMLICPADIVWGNGSIGNMWRYAYGKPVTVGAAHLRVLDTDFFRHWTGKNVSNSELVDLAFECAHQSQGDSWSHQDRNGTWLGGLSLTHAASDLVTLIHALPAPWLCSFTQQDVDFFSNAPHMNLWDQDWPSLLLEGKRWRVLGSSEIAFAVEITKAHMNQASIETGRKYFEGCQSQKPHNLVNGCFVIALVRKPYG